MDYQQKMTRHLRRTEALMEQIEVIEAPVLAKYRGMKNRKMAAIGIKRDLELDEELRQLAKSKNSAIALATMYGIAALVERQGS